MTTLKDHCDYVTDLDRKVADSDAWAQKMSVLVAQTLNYLDQVYGAFLNAGIPFSRGSDLVPPPMPAPWYG